MMEGFLGVVTVRLPHQTGELFLQLVHLNLDAQDVTLHPHHLLLVFLLQQSPLDEKLLLDPLFLVNVMEEQLVSGDILQLQVGFQLFNRIQEPRY